MLQYPYCLLIRPDPCLRQISLLKSVSDEPSNQDHDKSFLRQSLPKLLKNPRSFISFSAVSSQTSICRSLQILSLQILSSDPSVLRNSLYTLTRPLLRLHCHFCLD